MQVFKLDKMVRGWFVGRFRPTAYDTNLCEVAIKQYKAGDKEAPHVHHLADELTAVISGMVTMNGQQFVNGDIVLIPKGEICEFMCLEDAITVVYKSCSSIDDKYCA